MFLKKVQNYFFSDLYFVNSNFFYIRIYRWNPYFSLHPWFNIFPIKIEKNKNLMILDILFFIKAKFDSTLAFRRSCREGICGSCAMNINGINSLACLTNFKFNSVNFLTIYPLPHFLIIKDLICDFSNFYNQLKLIKPWIISKKTKKQEVKENLQSKFDRFELDGLYECILCACCSSSCPSYWWNYDKYLGPAILLQSYKWLVDSRDSSKTLRIKFLKQKTRITKCHNITNCSQVCPKKLNPAKVINFLKYYSYK